MRKLGILVSIMVLLAGGLTVRATVLTFDDLGPSLASAYNRVPSYGGLTWGNWYVTEPTKVAAWEDWSVSGDYSALFRWTSSATVSATEAFDFDGAYLAAMLNSVRINVRGLLNGNEAYTKVVEIGVKQDTWIDFNFTGITSLEFTAAPLDGSYAIFRMDDFTFNENLLARSEPKLASDDILANPEPTSILLLGLGLVGLVGLRKKLKK